MSQELNVFQAVNNIKVAVGAVGKTQQSGGDGTKYNYRGRDAVVDALSDLMAEQGVTVVPVGVKDVERDRIEKRFEQLISGTYLFAVYGPDGSSYPEPIEVFSQCQNTRDKAAGGFLSYAYRYALEIIFGLKTNDPDIDNEARNDDDDGQGNRSVRESHGGSQPPPQRRQGGTRATKEQIAHVVSMFDAFPEGEARNKAKHDWLTEFKMAKPEDLLKGAVQESKDWITARLGDTKGEPFGTDEPGDDQGDDDGTFIEPEPEEMPEDLAALILAVSTEANKVIKDTLESMGYWPPSKIPKKTQAAAFSVAKASIGWK